LKGPGLPKMSSTLPTPDRKLGVGNRKLVFMRRRWRRAELTVLMKVSTITVILLSPPYP
jgi:hypothetical protein